MDKLSAIAKAAAETAAGERPYFLEHPDCDRLLAMLLAAAGQISVLYERLDTLTRVLEQKGVLDAAELEAFSPDAAAQAARLEWDEAFVRRLMRVLTAEQEAIKRAAATPEPA